MENVTKRLFIYLLGLIMFTACSDDDIVYTGGDGGDIDLPQPEPNSAINEKLFEVINLDYPGLEKAKEYYEADQHYFAAKAILDYYRMRTSVVNPNLSLVNVTANESDHSKANYALDDYRFFVNNYYEDAGKQQPYSLKDGGAINWDFKPEGADDEYQKQLHRHQWFIPQAKVYRVTGKKEHIESWIAVYTDWLKVNADKTPPVLNQTTWWQLQVATRLYDQVELFEYYKNATQFTPQWFSTFMVYFAEHADFLVEHPYSDGNILVSQANALAFAGVLYPEFKNAETWMNTGYTILGQEVKTQFLEDGMHFELDFSYHISAIGDFYESMKLADANNLSGKLPADFKESLRKAAEVVMHFTYPGFFDTKFSGYLVPGFNDTRQTSWTRSVLTKNFNRHIEMFPDHQELIYMANGGKQGTRPGIEPVSFGKGGYHVLRNGWEPSSTMLIHSNNYDYNANPLQVWSHNQPDNGTFELYHNGRNFFPDTGVFAYSGGDNKDRKEYRQTKLHNTLTLDDKNITTAKGTLLKNSTETYGDVIVTENQGYEDLKHRRYIFFVDKEFFVLVDEGVGTGEGKVSLNFNLCEGSSSEVVIDETDKGAHTAFADGNNMIIRSFSNRSISSEAFTGKVSYNVGLTAERPGYTVNMNKPTDKAARFITVIYPVQGSTDATDISASFKVGGYNEKSVSLEVLVNGRTYDLDYEL